jgi:hypothetical protein
LKIFVDQYVNFDEPFDDISPLLKRSVTEPTRASLKATLDKLMTDL